jgi:hypothetical protein
LFVLVLVAAWLNTFLEQNGLMKREVYHNLMSDRLEITRIDDYFDQLTRVSFWSYLVMPPFLAVRLVLVTLLIQFPLLLRSMDMPFSRLFRIVTLAAIPLCLGRMTKILWLLQLPVSAINAETLAFVPLAVTNIILVKTPTSAAYSLLASFNMFELAWMIIVARELSSAGGLRKAGAGVLVSAVWTFIVLFQWSLILYLVKVNS